MESCYSLVGWKVYLCVNICVIVTLSLSEYFITAEILIFRMGIQVKPPKTDICPLFNV